MIFSDDGLSSDACAVLDALPLQAFVLNANAELIYANPACFEYSGDVDLTDAAWARVMHSDDLPTAVAARESWIAEGIGGSVDNRLLGKDDQYRWFRTNVCPVTDQFGNPLGWLGTHTDIDDLHSAG